MPRNHGKVCVVWNLLGTLTIERSLNSPRTYLRPLFPRFKAACGLHVIWWWIWLLLWGCFFGWNIKRWRWLARLWYFHVQNRRFQALITRTLDRFRFRFLHLLLHVSSSVLAIMVVRRGRPEVLQPPLWLNMVRLDCKLVWHLSLDHFQWKPEAKTIGGENLRRGGSPF